MAVTTSFGDVTSCDRPAAPIGGAGTRFVRKFLLGTTAVAATGVAVVTATLAIGWALPKLLPTKHGGLARAHFGLRHIALAPLTPAVASGHVAKELGPADIVVFPLSVAEAARPARVAVRKVNRTNRTPLPLAMPPELARLRTAEKQIAAIPPAPPPAAQGRDRMPHVANAPEAVAPDNRTAVYDISARAVYLPNGQTLEAHSGLGNWRDNPRYVGLKDRGPTPPNTYDLSLRERLFHGVRAIRLTPVDEVKMFDRDGMLAHTYMLGPKGDSNGCVSFKNYPAFLQAYLKGDIDRLVVVSQHGATLARTAHANGKLRVRYAVNER